MKKIRLDTLLVEQGYFADADAALRAVLDAFGQDVRGLRCLDIGSSTGGFSDCLLQAGAASVACVDVNYGQLAWKLRQDPRVSVFERVNIKLADPVELGAPFDEAVRRRTVDEVRAALADAGFDATGVVESPITGPEGNVEYLVRAVFEGSRDDGGRGEGGRS